MLRGYLDSITSLGYVEGWAFDPEKPSSPLQVAVLWDGVEVAWGLAHRYREDLMLAGLGLGWCALRLRLGVPIEQAQKGVVRLVERSSGADIYVTEGLPVIPDGTTPVESIEALKTADPTVIGFLGIDRRTSSRVGCTTCDAAVDCACRRLHHSSRNCLSIQRILGTWPG